MTEYEVFVREVAKLTRDGETREGELDEFVMENDDAFETLDTLIGQARRILGWKEYIDAPVHRSE